jgi:hypothetical protein
MVTDMTKKLAATEIARSSDYGGLVVSGMDRYDISNRIQSWQSEIEANLDSMRAFEVF